MSVGILYGNFKWGIIKINNIFVLFILQYPMLREVILYIEKKNGTPCLCSYYTVGDASCGGFYVIDNTRVTEYSHQ